MKHIVPRIVAFITQHPRYIVRAGVNFKWVSDDGLFLLTNALYRSWELIAGRRLGIKPMCAMRVVDGVVIKKFFCFESWITHQEALLQLYFRELFSYWKQPILYPYAMRGAISFVAGTGASTSITSSGSDIMILSGIMNIAEDIGAVAFNSVSMNQIDTNNFGVNNDSFTYMLKNQAATSGLTNQGSANYNLYCYNGVSQKDTAGTVDKHAVTTGSSTTPSGSITPTRNNCWVWCNISTTNTAATISGWTNMNNHFGQASPSSAPEDAGDSGNVATPSSQTQSETLSASGAWAVMQISMADTSAGSTIIPTMLLMGVG